MSGDERRSGARFITELSVVLRPSKGGEPLDDRATAHDVSIGGFKVETQAQLTDNMMLSFTFELPRGQTATGKGRVVWTNRETFASWAGVEIVSMPWGDKRRLGKLLNPDGTDWERISNLCIKLAMILTVIAAAHRVLMSAHLRSLFASLAPKMIALLVMGWALVNLLKRPRR
ncbi:MAG: PilZ domain-containing protein [Elusimicrobia bacterium]|nr:PilZ domain-containing protein [Elusimicrobiota bacterium]